MPIVDQQTRLSDKISKIGVQAEVFDFAHHRSALYGAIAIVVALFAGWLGNAVFRKA